MKTGSRVEKGRKGIRKKDNQEEERYYGNRKESNEGKEPRTGEEVRETGGNKQG